MAKCSRWYLNTVMMIALIACMSYSLLGEAVHEWLGVVVLACFVWHVLRNRRWFVTLWRGRYNSSRVAGNIVNGLILFTVLGLIVSSVMLSQYVFAFLPLSFPDGVGQTPHQVCAYWGFLLMAVHLGWHGRALAASVTQRLQLPVWCWRIALLCVVLLGVVSAIAQRFPAHLFMQVRGFEVASGPLFFLIGEAALFALCALAGAACKRFLQMKKGGTT
ncbi:MAG: hypothetical protein UDG94_01295 [Peptococcaceae bacterium]|nr:hypothetical protein [Peptococcaceae bacterium]